MDRRLVLLSLLVCASLDLSSADDDLKWWQTTVVYQIYPRSYQDSDSDGVGDLKGITSRLDHIKELGAGAIWLSPIYESPMADFGYDISNHSKIDPIFGSLEDFDEMVEEAHGRGIKIIMDYIPNHTSNLHPWFQSSLEGEDNEYADYYIWRDGKELEDGSVGPPSNWLSIFGGSAWERNEDREKYYLHQFLKEQPDLNWRNPRVQEEMKDVFRFWCKRGVDGFRIDAISTMYEVEDLRDEPPSGREGMRTDDYRYLDHPYTYELEEIHDIIPQWREVLDECGAEREEEIYMVMETYHEDMTPIMKYYFSGASMPFNFQLISIDQDCDAICIEKLILKWMNQMPEGKWPNWVTGNHDQLRITGRKGALYARAMNMLLLTLPGTPTTYYGEELGLKNIQVSYEDTQDPWGIFYGPEKYDEFSRDPCRAPMQWSDDDNAGFSDADQTWLPVHEDYVTNNVDAQTGDERSVLEAYRALIELRQDADFMNAEMAFVHVDEDIISYRRRHESSPGHLVAINVGNTTAFVDFRSLLPDCDSIGIVAETTRNFHIENDSEILLSEVTLAPGQGITIRLASLHSEL